MGWLGLESTCLAAKLSALYELLAGCVVTAHNSDRWKHRTLGERVRVTML